MTIKSKWPKLGTLLLAGFVLAACGDNGQDNQTQEENAPSNGEEASSEKTSDEATDQEGSDDQASNEETVEITFWHAMNGPHQEALTALTDEFNESQDQYFVNEQSQGEYGDLNQSVTAAAVSDELPTMAQLTPTDVPEWASNDLIVTLTDDFLTANGLDQEAIDDIYPGFLESGTFDGERYAMPFSKSTRIMFYNQDILDEYGVEVPETWDQVLDLADQMIEGGDDAYAMGLENNFEMEWETMARQNGSDFVDPDSGTVDLNGPEAVEALELIQGMLEDGQARTAGEDGFMSGPFGNGASALYIGSSAGTTHVAPAAEGINWSTAPIPTFNDTELTLFAGNDLGLFSSATEEEQPVLWLIFPSSWSLKMQLNGLLTLAMFQSEKKPLTQTFTRITWKKTLNTKHRPRCSATVCLPQPLKVTASSVTTWLRPWKKFRSTVSQHKMP
ncbi:ABC transporter substrate-binding protein [Alloiococcus otitis]|uniref:ABC transporter substrate-binding protein n=1 Tax=Alloiococcus otitis TaxID=1652 RepID=UPI0023570B90|nr:ABC transporter substrate-binding protein [Alloiococcus otitis]